MTTLRAGLTNKELELAQTDRYRFTFLWIARAIYDVAKEREQVLRGPNWSSLGHRPWIVVSGPVYHVIEGLLGRRPDATCFVRISDEGTSEMAGRLDMPASSLSAAAKEKAA